MTCNKPAQIRDSRLIDRNVTRRRYNCKDPKCGAKWSTVEMIIADRVYYKKLMHEMNAAARTIEALKQIRNIVVDAL